METPPLQVPPPVTAQGEQATARENTEQDKGDDNLNSCQAWDNLVFSSMESFNELEDGPGRIASVSFKKQEEQNEENRASHRQDGIPLEIFGRDGAANRPLLVVRSKDSSAQEGSGGHSRFSLKRLSRGSLKKRPNQRPTSIGSVKRNSKGLYIGDYEVGPMIGMGTQGMVTKCKHYITNEPVAVKTILGGSMHVQKKVRGRFRRPKHNLTLASNVGREIALLKKVNHPNCVKLLGVIDTIHDNDIHLVLEFVTGSPLAGLADNLLLRNEAEQLPIEDARVYFRQLCCAVHYLHYHGIVHRDIKPANLIIDQTTKILKLTDLGIACEVQRKQGEQDDALVASSMLIGTPAFLPPEYYKIKAEEDQIREAIYQKFIQGHKDAEEDTKALANRPAQVFSGKPADVWAMGVTLFAFTFGALPFCHPRRLTPSNIRAKLSKSSHDPNQVPDVNDLQTRVLENPLRFPGKVLYANPLLRSLLSSILAKDPNKRLTIDQVFGHPWLNETEPMPLLSEEQRQSIEPTELDKKQAIIKIGGFVSKIRRKLRIWRSKLKEHKFSHRKKQLIENNATPARRLHKLQSNETPGSTPTIKQRQEDENEKDHAQRAPNTPGYELVQT